MCIYCQEKFLKNYKKLQLELREIQVRLILPPEVIQKTVKQRKGVYAIAYTPFLMG